MNKFISLENCTLCPRECGVNRLLGEKGYCNCNDKPLVSSIFLHKGEEPVISGTKGICNVFFSHCNLRCEYCQNYQISRNHTIDDKWLKNYNDIVDCIANDLDKGVRLLGFVSPTHQTYQMVEIIDRLWQKGYKPTIVYNSNGYDSVETLKKLEGVVDVYLPDFKYYDNSLGRDFSDISNYFEIASLSLKEMYRQKGSTLLLDDFGIVESGIIVRHLVIPGFSDDSISILEFIANEISNNIHISLMSQYYPTSEVIKNQQLKKVLTITEYEKVIAKVEELGFKGWIQDLNSSTFYQPDFSDNSPFKE
ncbi:MAG: 4Fe-4S cluster-binding domain-containing protein [Tenuifilaceae bacterium]